MLMPLERRTRPASTEVRRSSQNVTGKPVHRSNSAPNSRTHPDWRPSEPRMLMGLPIRISPTSRSFTSDSKAARSVRLFVRTKLDRPCAVILKGSLIANPIRFLPRSSARMRGWEGVKSISLYRGQLKRALPNYNQPNYNQKERFMPESENIAELSTWGAPECPFTIEYAPRALDDIRLAVVDAFF